jgi:hypothetical protein
LAAPPSWHTASTVEATVEKTAATIVATAVAERIHDLGAYLEADK